MDSSAFDAIARRHGIRLLLQFGSSVTGKQHANSDIDLAVLLERAPASWESEADLVVDLQPLFPGCEVDVAVVNRADPLFLKQIMATARLLFGPKRALHELRIYAFKRYQDHRRFLALERRYVIRAIDALTR